MSAAYTAAPRVAAAASGDGSSKGSGSGTAAPARSAAAVQLCRAFQRGECPRGAACKFAHTQ